MKKYLIVMFIVSINFYCKNKSQGVEKNSTTTTTVLNSEVDTLIIGEVKLLITKKLPEKIRRTILSSAKKYFSAYPPINSLIRIEFLEQGLATSRTFGTKFAEASNGYLNIMLPKEELVTMDSVSFISLIFHELTHTQRGPKITLKEPFQIQGTARKWNVVFAEGLAYFTDIGTFGYEGIEEAGAELISYNLDKTGFSLRTEKYKNPGYKNAFFLLKRLCEKNNISVNKISLFQKNSGVEQLLQELKISKDKKEFFIRGFGACMAGEDFEIVIKKYNLL